MYCSYSSSFIFYNYTRSSLSSNYKFLISMFRVLFGSIIILQESNYDTMHDDSKFFSIFSSVQCLSSPSLLAAKCTMIAGIGSCGGLAHNDCKCSHVTLCCQAIRARFLGVGTGWMGLGGVHILRQNKGPCNAWLVPRKPHAC